MSRYDDLIGRVRVADRAPSNTPLPEEVWTAATLLEVIERRSAVRSEQLEGAGPGEEAVPVPERLMVRHRRIRGPLVAVGAAAVALVIAAVTLFIMGLQEPVEPTDTVPPTEAPPVTTTPGPEPAELEVTSWEVASEQRGLTPYVTAISRNEVQVDGVPYRLSGSELAATDEDSPILVDGDGHRWESEVDGAGNRTGYLRVAPSGAVQRVELPIIPDRGADIEVRGAGWLRTAPDGSAWVSVLSDRTRGKHAPYGFCLDAFRFDGDAWVPAATCEQIPRPEIPDNNEGLSIEQRAAPGPDGVVWVANGGWGDRRDRYWMLHRIDGDYAASYRIPDGFPEPYWGDLLGAGHGDRLWMWNSNSGFGGRRLASFGQGSWTLHGDVVDVAVAADGTVWALSQDPSEEDFTFTAGVEESLEKDEFRSRPTLSKAMGVEPHADPTLLWFNGRAWVSVWEGEGKCYNPIIPELRQWRPTCGISVAPDGTVWLAQREDDDGPVTVTRIVGVDTRPAALPSDVDTPDVAAHVDLWVMRGARNDGWPPDIEAIAADAVEVDGFVHTVVNNEFTTDNPNAYRFEEHVDRDGNRWFTRGAALVRIDPSGTPHEIDTPTIPNRGNLMTLPGRGDGIEAHPADLAIAPDGALWVTIRSGDTSRKNERDRCVDMYRWDGTALVPTVPCEAIPRNRSADPRDVYYRTAPGIGTTAYVFNTGWAEKRGKAIGAWQLHRIDGDRVESFDAGTHMSHESAIEAGADGSLWLINAQAAPLGFGHRLIRFHDGVWSPFGAVFASDIGPNGTVAAIVQDPTGDELQSFASMQGLTHWNRPTLSQVLGIPPHQKPTLLLYDDGRWYEAWRGTGKCYTISEHTDGDFTLYTGRSTCEVSIASDGTIWIAQANPGDVETTIVRVQPGVR